MNKTTLSAISLMLIMFSLNTHSQIIKNKKHDPFSSINLSSGNSTFLKWNVLEAGLVKNEDGTKEIYYSPALSLGIGLNYGNNVSVELDGIYNISAKNNKNQHITLRGTILAHLTRIIGVGASVDYLPTKIEKLDFGYRLRFKVPIFKTNDAEQDYYNGNTKEVYIDLAGMKNSQFIPSRVSLTFKLPIVTSNSVYISPGFAYDH